MCNADNHLLLLIFQSEMYRRFCRGMNWVPASTTSGIFDTDSLKPLQQQPLSNTSMNIASLIYSRFIIML